MRRVNTMPELSEISDLTDKFSCMYKKKKYKWYDGKGRYLTAGGILPYDVKGIWVIGEQDKSGIITYTDAGGKYQFEDGDIFKTIAREFGEETYHTCDVTRSQISDLANIYDPVYVNGHENKPVYMCLVVPKMSLEGVLFNDDLLKLARDRVLKENPFVPPNYYNSITIRRIPFDQLNSPDIRLSYRLRRILKHGPLSSKIPFFDSPRSSPTSSFKDEKI